MGPLWARARMHCGAFIGQYKNALWGFYGPYSPLLPKPIKAQGILTMGGKMGHGKFMGWRKLVGLI